MNRGDIVIVEFPYVEGRRWKNRPALVVQIDHDNQRLSNTIVAMISGNVEHAGEPTQLFIDPATPEGSATGLHGPSVAKCSNLFTVAQADIRHVIGSLPQAMMGELESCLKAALALN